MSQPPTIDYSVSMIAREFGVSRATVAKKLKSANVHQFGTKKGAATYRLQDFAALFVSLEAEEGDYGLVPQSPKERLDYYRAAREKTKHEVECAELVPATEHFGALALFAKTVAATLDTLPDVLERDCGLSNDVLDRVQDSVDALREQLHEAVTSAEDSKA